MLCSSIFEPYRPKVAKRPPGPVKRKRPNKEPTHDHAFHVTKTGKLLTLKEIQARERTVNCKHWMRGYCRRGSSCRFAHPGCAGHERRYTGLPEPFRGQVEHKPALKQALKQAQRKKRPHRRQRQRRRPRRTRTTKLQIDTAFWNEVRRSIAEEEQEEVEEGAEEQEEMNVYRPAEAEPLAKHGLHADLENWFKQRVDLPTGQQAVLEPFPSLNLIMDADNSLGLGDNLGLGDSLGLDLETILSTSMNMGSELETSLDEEEEEEEGSQDSESPPQDWFTEQEGGPSLLDADAEAQSLGLTGEDTRSVLLQLETGQCTKDFFLD